MPYNNSHSFVHWFNSWKISFSLSRLRNIFAKMKLWQVALLICATSISTSECWINPSTYSYLLVPTASYVSSNFQQAMSNFQVSMANMKQSLGNAFGLSFPQQNQLGSNSWRHHVWNPSILSSSYYYSDKTDQSIILDNSFTCWTTILLYSIYF